MIKKKNNLLLITAIAAFSASLLTHALAARVGVEAERLTGTELYGMTTVTVNSDGSTSISFAQQSPYAMPDVSAGILSADAGVAAGAFVGDYVSAGVRGLSFWVKSDGHLPKGAELVLKSRTGRKWFNKNVTVSNISGAWVVNNVYLNRNAGWDRNEPSSVDKDALWNEDLTQVVYIGVSFSQGGLEAQTYTVSHFKLIGQEGFTIPQGVLTSWQVALFQRFGVTHVEYLTETQKMQDADADGMTDVNEILAGTNPDDPASVFFAEIVEINEEGVLLRWPCVYGAVYAVSRSSNLVEGVFTSIVEDLQATITGYMTYRDVTATNNTPYFYMVRKKIE
jgi:hypothetical protein